MSFSFGNINLGDASFGTVQLGQISFGSEIIWEKVVPNSMVLEIDKSIKELELPLEQYMDVKWEVNWGDGTKETGGTKHSYTDGATGNHRVTVSGAAKWTKKINGSYYTTPTSLRSGLVSVAVNGMCPIRVWPISAFNGCTALQTIDDGLFNGVVPYDDGENMGVCFGVNYWIMDNFFTGCSKLKSIPEKLITNVASGAKSKSMKNISFYQTFYQSGITSIPEALFSGLPSLTWANNEEGEFSMDSTFSRCNSLTKVGRIFDNLPTKAQSVNFGYVFAYCTGITSISDALFSKVPTIGGSWYGVSNRLFNAAFRNCTGLKSVPTNILSGIANDSKVDITYFFDSCIGITTKLPEVWNTHGSTKHTGFYVGCSNASNYGTVPSAWKNY